MTSDLYEMDEQNMPYSVVQVWDFRTAPGQSYKLE